MRERKRERAERERGREREKGEMKDGSKKGFRCKGVAFLRMETMGGSSPSLALIRLSWGWERTLLMEHGKLYLDIINLFPIS